ncbi:MAG: DUF6515 family protein [Burkholderiaceae bacterium]
MKLRIAASTALLMAFATLPINPWAASTAHAFGATQTAPPNYRAAQRAPRAAQGLAPSPYFDRGTRVPLAQPKVRERSRRHVDRSQRRYDNRRHRTRRIDVNRPQAGSIGLRRGAAQGTGPGITQTLNDRPRRRSTASPSAPGVNQVADRRNERRVARRIDRRSPHASRDTTGISFGPRQVVSTLPRTSALRAPQFPYFGPRPGTRTDTLSRDAQRFNRRGFTWYFSSGHWYRSHRHGGFVVVFPPIGLSLPSLPVGSEQVFYDGQPYFIAGGVTLRKTDDEYLVVNAPQIAPSDRGYYINAIDQIAEPKRGQSERKFGRDVDRCEARAEARSGFDPGREDASRAAERRYQSFSRSLSRCLQTAGYSLY